MGNHWERQNRRRHGRGFLAAAIAVFVLLLAGFLVVTLFRIRDVEVTGNSFYSEKEIIEKVVTDEYTSNSLFLYLKYQYLGGEEIPFVDKIEVSFQSPGKVKLRVYEKSVVGYVTHMGANLYFDKDGIVVESSAEVSEGIPCISGLNFNSLALYKKLQVQDDSVFERILNITQLVKKYELTPDKIEFGANMELTLYFDQVRVALGNSGSLEEKVGRLHELYSDLEGRSGVFHMENYTENSKFISFEQDEKGKEATEDEDEAEEGETGAENED
ncbi:MAG: FtsQ-type POTRA domain-containing protein [Lachnospiraceae bacterium]|jgi:cell division protein FtsQ|nr:FtsQ-type POTRA domain-containing protein [Lachnospiraceae bacterium]